MEALFRLCTRPAMTVAGGVLLAASLAAMLAGWSWPLDPAWGTVAVCGFPLVYLAVVRLVRDRQISSALLISVAMAASIAIGELFAAGEVAFIMAIGEWLEDRTVERAQKGLRRLFDLVPATARRVTDGGESVVAADTLKVGDTVRLLPGEAVPADGVIVSGMTSLDQSVMTGESLPVDKSVGDEVFCGTVNRFGTVDIRVTKTGDDASLRKLIRLVEEAQEQAPMQRIVDRWAQWLVPAAMVIAVVAYLVTSDIVRAVTVLVVFCPCALVLATPTSIMAAVGQAAKNGVIVKSGEALERMGQVDLVAFDKTGTLTSGLLAVSDVFPCLPDWTERDVLALAASAEARSEHPLGQAIVACARLRGVTMETVSDFVMEPGRGIRGRVGDRAVLCGTAAFAEQCGMMVPDVAVAALERFRRQGKAAVLVMADGRAAGVVALSDTVRPQARQVVEALRRDGIETVLLTGDHAQTAEYVARQVGVDTVYAELLPERKAAQVERFRQDGRVVCMVGDGVNDALALETADVGVAMGTMGSDLAVEAADIALMGDDPGRIAYLKRLSRATVSSIRFNITLSMAINAVAIVLSVMGVLGPISGALVHNVGSVLVVLNAALLYDRRFDDGEQAAGEALPAAGGR